MTVREGSKTINDKVQKTIRGRPEPPEKTGEDYRSGSTSS
jgi:hypothetical protein